MKFRNQLQQIPTSTSQIKERLLINYMAKINKEKQNIFKRMFNIGFTKDAAYPTRNVISKGGEVSSVRDKLPSNVQGLWDWWEASHYDDEESWKNREDMYDDMDRLFYNCIGASERLLTYEEGLVPIKEVAGKDLTVMTSKGWNEGKIQKFGKGILYDIHFKRRGYRQDRIVRATLDHRWRVKDGSFKTTDELESFKKERQYTPTNKIKYIYAERHKVDEDSIDYILGVRHGLIYGDGSTVKRCERTLGYQIRLCMDHDDLLPYFEGYKINRPPSFDGDPVIFLWDEFSKTHPLKELPPEYETDDYLVGFFRGWLGADGTVGKNGKVSICCGLDEEAWLRKYMPRIGIQFNNATKVSRKRTNFINGREVISRKELVTLRLNNVTLFKDDFIIKRKRDRFKEISIPEWSFSHIDYDSGKEEELYCAIVPSTQDFTLEDGLLTGNSPIIQRGMKLYPDEVVQADSNTRIIGVEAKRKQKNFLLKFFDDIGIDNHIRPTASDIVQYGNAGWMLSFSDKGVDDILPINIRDLQSRIEFSPIEVKRELKNKSGILTQMASKISQVKQLADSVANSDDYATYFKKYLFGFQINDLAVPPWRFLHFRNYTNKSPFAPFGMPMFVHSVAPFRQFDSARILGILARGAKFPIDKYTLKIPNSADPTTKLQKVLEIINQIDNSGLKSTKKEGNGLGERIITIEDLFDFDQISPNIDLDSIDDLEMLRDDLILSTNLPRNFLDPNGSGFGESGVALIQQHKPFAREVYAVQSQILEQVTQLCKIHMIQSGEFKEEEIDFQLSMPYPEAQTNPDIISSQSDLLDLTNDIIDAFSDKLTGDPDERLPDDIIKQIYTKVLPYDSQTIDNWVDAIIKNRDKENPIIEETKSIEDKAKKTRKALTKLGKKAINEAINEVCYGESSKVNREFKKNSKHFYSSVKKPSDFNMIKLLEFKKESVKKLQEEIRFEYNAPETRLQIRKKERNK